MELPNITNGANEAEIPAARQRRIREAVSRGVSDWREQRSAFLELPRIGATPRSNGHKIPGSDLGGLKIDPSRPGVLASLPRRKPTTTKIADATPPRMRVVTFSARRRRVIARFFLWLWLLFTYFLGDFWDALAGQRSIDRRAVRLRQTLERGGGTAAKIGHYLAARLDLLPWAYSIELSRMQDKMAPFPVEEAVRRIERATGRPLAATFVQFDPTPIVSTSIACTFQAVLHSGDRVVVRVRRPGAGELVMSDLKVLDWFLSIVEFLTILRPGFTRGMRRELRETLLEELNFIQEARHQDLFRRAAKKSGKRFFTAPRIHFDLINDDVIVEEFAEGMWLWEVLAAQENADEAALARMQQLNISPKKLARRLTWVTYWGWDEHLFFHANPHPDRIIVGPNSRLIFTDFSTVSTVSRTKREALQQNMYYASEQDALNMARSSLILLEPLPPLDVIEFTKELESYNWQMLYVFGSDKKAAIWSERTLAIQWLGLIKVARKHNVTIDFHVLRLLRTTMVANSIAARLYKELDVIEEYERYTVHRARRARDRVTEGAFKRLTGERDETIYLRLERLANTGMGMFFRLRHSLAIPSVNFSSLMSKWSFIVFTLIKFLAQVSFITGLLLGYLVLRQLPEVPPLIGEGGLLLQLVSSRGYHLLLFLLIFINGRSVLFRLDDTDVQ